MTPTTTLQITPIAPRTASGPLTPAQKRFNTLLRQIDKARQTLADWAAHTQSYRQAHAELWVPLQAELLRGHRQFVRALDGLLTQTGWTRAERETLTDLICEVAAAVLADDDTDTEMRALFERHAKVDYDSDVRDSMLAMKDLAEAMTGMDLGEDEGIATQDDLMARLQQRLHQEMAERQAAQDQPAPTPRRRSAAQQRREDQVQQASQSLREIYRQLVSALHPDREPDAALRATKTAQMQRVNQAYEQQDLLTLLSLQLEIEQIDARHVAQASEARLKHYNQLLAAQKDELHHEIQRVEMGFRMEFNLQPGWGLNPHKLGQVLEDSVLDLRCHLTAQQVDLQRLQDKVATKRWLKKARQQRREQDLEFDFF